MLVMSSLGARLALALAIALTFVPLTSAPTFAQLLSHTAQSPLELPEELPASFAEQFLLLNQLQVLFDRFGDNSQSGIPQDNAQFNLAREKLEQLRNLLKSVPEDQRLEALKQIHDLQSRIREPEIPTAKGLQSAQAGNQLAPRARQLLTDFLKSRRLPFDIPKSSNSDQAIQGNGSDIKPNPTNSDPTTAAPESNPRSPRVTTREGGSSQPSSTGTFSDQDGSQPPENAQSGRGSDRQMQAVDSRTSFTEPSTGQPAPDFRSIRNPGGKLPGPLDFEQLAEQLRNRVTVNSANSPGKAVPTSQTPVSEPNSQPAKRIPDVAASDRKLFESISRWVPKNVRRELDRSGWDDFLKNAVREANAEIRGNPKVSVSSRDNDSTNTNSGVLESIIGNSLDEFKDDMREWVTKNPPQKAYSKRPVPSEMIRGLNGQDVRWQRAKQDQTSPSPNPSETASVKKGWGETALQWFRTTSSLALPQSPELSGISQFWFPMMILGLLFGIAGLGIWFFRKPIHTNLTPSWLGLTLQNPQELIRAFHFLVESNSSQIPNWWPHRRASDGLTILDENRSSLESLVSYYEQARYAPEVLSNQQLQNAQQAFERLCENARK